MDKSVIVAIAALGMGAKKNAQFLEPFVTRLLWNNIAQYPNNVHLFLS
jgi:hypothetical protein